MSTCVQFPEAKALNHRKLEIQGCELPYTGDKNELGFFGRIASTLNH